MTILPVGALAFVIVLVFIYSLQISQTTTVQTSQFVNETLSDSSDVMKIDISSKYKSVDPAIQFDAVLEGNRLSIFMLNGGADDKDVKVDSWEASIASDDWTFSEPVTLSESATLPSKGSATIASIDLSKYQDLFDIFPGEYTVNVVGWRWYDKDFGDYKKPGKYEDYMLTAKLNVSYDTDVIKASNNKFLKSDGMVISIEGSGEPYKVDKSSSQTVTFYIANEGSSPVSGLISGSTFDFWHSDNRFPGVRNNLIAEPYADSCEILNPDESKMVNAFVFSSSTWPLVGPSPTEDLQDGELPPGAGIVQALKVGKPPLGLYIAHISVATAPCTTKGGEQISGGSFSGVVAIEVVE